MIRETELISLKDGKTKSLTEFVQDLAPTPEPMDLTPNTPVDIGGADPVALSSYIDGIADSSASDAITAGLASGGSIANAIAASSSQWSNKRADFGSVLKTLTVSYQNLISSTLPTPVVVSDKDFCIDLFFTYTMDGGSTRKLHTQILGHMIENTESDINFGSIIFDDPNIGITLNCTATVTSTVSPFAIKISKLTVKAKIDDAAKNCKIVSYITNILTR